MRAANLFFGVLLLVLFAVMTVPSFPATIWDGIGVSIPNPLYLIFDSVALFTIPFLNIGVTAADLVCVFAVLLMLTGLAPSKQTAK